MNGAVSDSAAFDAYAWDYDASFTNTVLGRMLRDRVWEALSAYFKPGSRVFEIACGTGEDAVWLACHGVRVTATDGSPEMLAVAEEKAKRARVRQMIRFGRVDITTMEFKDQGLNTGDFSADTPDAESSNFDLYDGALSDFGGINILNDWPTLANVLADIIRPGGMLVLVPMAPICPWEVAWFLLHGDVTRAIRRFRQPAMTVVGDANIPIWYPSAKRLHQDFGPWFDLVSTRSLGLCLPPSHLAHIVDRWPRLFAWLDRRFAPITRDWGDHYIIVFRRR